MTIRICGLSTATVTLRKISCGMFMRIWLNISNKSVMVTSQTVRWTKHTNETWWHKVTNDKYQSAQEEYTWSVQVWLQEDSCHISPRRIKPTFTHIALPVYTDWMMFNTKVIRPGTFRQQWNERHLFKGTERLMVCYEAKLEIRNVTWPVVIRARLSWPSIWLNQGPKQGAWLLPQLTYILTWHTQVTIMVTRLPFLVISYNTWQDIVNLSWILDVELVCLSVTIQGSSSSK